MAAMVRRPGARIAPMTSTTAWRKVGSVRQDRKGFSQADRRSQAWGWTGMATISHNQPKAWEAAMAEMGRTEILARYRHLRAISTHHHNEALRFVPHSALMEQARRLGLTVGKMLVAESPDEVTLAFDLSLYTAPPGRSRGIDRYARSTPVVPGSDEDVMLQALRRARFSVW